MDAKIAEAESMLVEAERRCASARNHAIWWLAMACVCLPLAAVGAGSVMFCGDVR